MPRSVLCELWDQRTGVDYERPKWPRNSDLYEMVGVHHMPAVCIGLNCTVSWRANAAVGCLAGADTDGF